MRRKSKEEGIYVFELLINLAVIMSQTEEDQALGRQKEFSETILI